MDVEGVCPDTLVGAPASDETVVVPQLPVVVELAWSDAADDEPGGRSWGDVWGSAFGVLAACGAVAVAIVIVHHGWVHRHPGETAAARSVAPSVSVAPTKVAVAVPTAAPGPVVTVTVRPTPTPTPEAVPVPSSDVADAQFVAALQRAGLKIINRDAVIGAGRNICVALAGGHSQDEIAADIVKSNASFNSTGAYATVAAAVNAYCPEQRRGD